MSTATFTFNLNEDSDEYTYRAVQKASEMRTVLQELAKYLRDITKYPADNTPDLVIDERHLIKDEFERILFENEVSMDFLIR